MIIIFIILCCSFVKAQGIESGKFIAGGSVDWGFSIGSKSDLGFAFGGEYMPLDQLGVLIDYSVLYFHNKPNPFVRKNVDMTVTAPCFFLMYHFFERSNWDPFFGLGVGYTHTEGKISLTGASDSWLDSRKYLILPQLKVGLRYWITEQWSVRGNVGLYRTLTVGFDYSL